ncbi:4-hydroxy-2-oxoheptanedioate aldolase [Hasllibacter halocynthiae]|uniref:4-hydroxy-2-oxoheptanedioate aldolase n=1 Tax=Hasllibacter halocynthiae TaxID=595589 RepID=A0A2T0X8L7_9RHOB|nr:HpcH/HpaI aldolase/citrate lyase family protein [Hasllibacter halocynthiae]PRY95269.1 4-hydroxy-2-oxoheptanedioate aldolase [Hasllibacter halocynthiae]
MNPLKAALRAGRLQRGLWLATASDTVAEVAAGAGFDWLLIDAEHGPNDPLSILSQLRAIASGTSLSGQGPEPVVRVSRLDEAEIKRVLDLGCRSVLVPMVNTPEAAAAAVAAVRYPPSGRRGVGAGLARASGYGTNPAYVAEADADQCLIVQAETAEALGNLDAIARTEGVDCVFVGPADLSADLGHPGAPDHPEVLAAIDGAIETIRGAGKAAGIVDFTREAHRRWEGRGVIFLGLGGDTGCLQAGMAALLQE